MKPLGTKSGLMRRTMAASAVLATVVCAAFAVLLAALDEERDSRRLAIHSRAELRAADRLEKLVVDLETGVRGFVITREDRFLEPWRNARRAFPEAARRLARTADDARQARRAQRIERMGVSYIADYSTPLVDAVRRGDPVARSVRATAEGKRRVDALRVEFATFRDIERAILTERDRAANADTQRAIVAATVGLAASVLLIVGFGTYLTRIIVVPVRRAAAMSGRLAAGNLAVRMPERGIAELGALERSFNSMAQSLEAGRDEQRALTEQLRASRDELRHLAEEQAALRRVATLVARGVPAPELFDAVRSEVQRLLAADGTRLLRYENDGTASGVPDGERFTLEGESVSATVLRTGRPARIESYEDAPGSIATALRGAGLRSSVGAPVVVEGRLWGVMIASWKEDEAPSADTEARIAQFTELVATAIANAESRAELAASRARVVATADETRRRVQRDLHDGAQQRLVHTVITLKLALRELADPDAPGTALVREALGHAERANAELRELAHGIMPAVLIRGGLRAGVESLVSRVSLPVSVDVTGERLPHALESTAYFIVAEALTNVIKHAFANRVQVRAVVTGGALRLEVRDDGVGGARVDGSAGLLGLQDRASALDGELQVHSPPGGGTLITAVLPVPDR